MRCFFLVVSLFIVGHLHAMENACEPLLLIPGAHTCDSLMERNLNALHVNCAFDCKTMSHGSKKCLIKDLLADEKRLSHLLQTADIVDENGFEEIKNIIKRTVMYRQATFSATDAQGVDDGYTLDNCCDMHAFFMTSAVPLDHDAMQASQHSASTMEKSKTKKGTKPKFSLLDIIKPRTADKVAH